MKKILSIIFIAVLSLSSCDKGSLKQKYSREYGAEVIFGSSSKHGSGTKVSYSGWLNSSDFERIDWVAGDDIRIYCPEASAPVSKYTDYYVSAGTISYSGSASSAQITKNPSVIGLNWGTGTHHFTALYPAPGTGVSGTSVSAGTVTCVLPASQTYSGISATSGNTVAACNPSYIYLAGYAEAPAGGSGEPVEVYFDPAITTFEITLQNDYSSHSNMTVQSAGITTASGKLNGTYTVNVTGINGTTGTLATSDIGTSGLVSATSSMAFDPAVAVAYGKTLKFTLFAQPGNDITQLTFWFKDSEGYTRSFDFKYSNGNWVSFTAFHKTRITGLLAPESASWTINTVPVVTSWNSSGDDYNKDIDIEAGRTQTFTTPAVVTWGTGVDNDDITLKDEK